MSDQRADTYQPTGSPSDSAGSSPVPYATPVPYTSSPAADQEDPWNHLLQDNWKDDPTPPSSPGSSYPTGEVATGYPAGQWFNHEVSAELPPLEPPITQIPPAEKPVEPLRQEASPVPAVQPQPVPSVASETPVASVPDAQVPVPDGQVPAPEQPSVVPPGKLSPPVSPSPGLATWAVVSDSTIVGSAIPVLGSPAWEAMTAQMSNPVSQVTNDSTKNPIGITATEAGESLTSDTADEDAIVTSAKTHKGLKKGVKIVLASVLSVVLLTGGGLAYAWYDLNGRFKNEGKIILDEDDRPTAAGTSNVKHAGDPYAGRAVNILVLGSDQREDPAARVAGARADTSFVAHISADRTRIDLISIPRDTLITIPQCKGDDGRVISAAGWSNQMFNAAFAWGVDYGGSIDAGAQCAVMAVEKMSNVRIDAYVVVKFSGFRNVVNAVGGIDVELLCPIYAPKARGLDLPKGVSHLDGQQALNLARARTGKGLGDGSDLHRIHRQHAVFKAILNKVYDMNYVTDFPKLYGLTGAIIDSVDTNMGSSLADIAGLAYSLKGFDTSNITTVMIPVGGVAGTGRVQVIDYQAKPYWDAIRNDRPMPNAELTAPKTTGAEAPGDTANGPDYSQPLPEPEKGKPVVVQRPIDC
ncbi:MAG: LCP family protein [Propionibacteriaceae bacterium]|nr:LCP family protein [Propionibacteriaceae bacterium]